jgi:hypothetical protein
MKDPACYPDERDTAAMRIREAIDKWGFCPSDFGLTWVDIPRFLPGDKEKFIQGYNEGYRGISHSGNRAIIDYYESGIDWGDHDRRVNWVRDPNYVWLRYTEQVD